jgi:hypothetical protein
MTHLLQYKHPFAYLILLVLVILARIPGLHPEFLTHNESVLIVSADRLLKGFTLYSTIVTDHPPFSILLYAGLRYILQDHLFIGIRIISILYLFLCAVVFNQFVNDLKLQKYRSLIPGFWLILALSFPWHTAEVDGGFFAILPSLFSVYLLVKTFEVQNDNITVLLFSGILTSISFLLSYQTYFLYFAIPLMYFILRPAKASEITTLLIGFSIPIFAIITIFYFVGNLNAWWNNSILHFLDQALESDMEFKQIISSALKNEITWAYACILIPSLGGLIAMRAGVLRLNIQQRKIDSVMALWLFFAIITISTQGIYQLQNPFLFIVFPVAFYSYRFFISSMPNWIKNTLLLILFSYPIFSATQYFHKINSGQIISYPPNEDAFVNHLSDISTTHTDKVLILKELLPSEVIQGSQSVWIADPAAAMYYIRGNLNPGSRYIDYNLFANKLNLWPGNAYRMLYSDELAIADVYSTFHEDQPDWIVDSQEVFNAIRTQIPALFKSYTLEYNTPYFKIYAKK